MSEFTNDWWDRNLNTRMEEFAGWVGDHNAESKVFLRNWIKDSGLVFNNCLDIGCGLASEYFGFKRDGINIDFTGADLCKILYRRNISLGIPMIYTEADNIPKHDNYYDLVMSRHVLEHQPHFKRVLNEMIRLASKVAAHTFFIKPGSKEIINYDPNDKLYVNTYTRESIEKELQSNPKVAKFVWQHVNDIEIILIIYIRHK